MPKHDQRYVNFIQEYFYGTHRGNAKKSAENAGFSPITAHKKAGSWVGNSRQKSTNKTLWDMVQKERQKISENYGITEQELMDGYIRDSRFDPRKLIDDNGFSITNLKKLDDDTALSLAGFEIKETIVESGDGSEKAVLSRTVKFKFPDKKGNRDSMAKVKGMFIDRKEVSGPKGGPIDVRYHDVGGTEKTEKLLDLGNRLIKELHKKS